MVVSPTANGRRPDTTQPCAAAPTTPTRPPPCVAAIPATAEATAHRCPETHTMKHRSRHAHRVSQHQNLRSFNDLNRAFDALKARQRAAAEAHFKPVTDSKPAGGDPHESSDSEPPPEAA